LDNTEQNEIRRKYSVKHKTSSKSIQ